MSEDSIRIQFIAQGPWREKGEKAIRFLSKKGKGRELKFLNLLRPHWEGGGIFLSEGLIRDSFDEALTEYQLYELAIENNYIKPDAIPAETRQALIDLLWSRGARRYLALYDYVTVVFLAQRLEIDLGFPVIALPKFNSASEVRFAAFLSQHSLWYEDQILDDWLGFLDNYRIIKDRNFTDAEILKKHLLREVDKHKQAVRQLLMGADRFISRLSDLFSLSTDDEKLSYGMFYSYWMARFFGFRRTGSDGFQRIRNATNWFEAITSSGILRDMTGDEAVSSEFHRRGALVYDVWLDVAAQLNQIKLPASR